MELRGVIADGRIVVEGGLGLLDGTRVSISLRRAKGGPRRTTARKVTNSLLDLASLGVATGRADLADRHDELLDGAPAKKSARRTARAGKRSS